MEPEALEWPPGWGGDGLSDFIGLAIRNTFATFYNRHREYEILSHIDGIYHGAIDKLKDPESILASLLLLRSHAAFRASVRLAMSGQIPECFATLRNCMEYALYAHHLFLHPESGEVWMRRHDDAASLKTVRSEFGYSNVTRTLKKADAVLGEVADNLYNRAIDYGADPNERAMCASLEFIERTEAFEIRQVYLNGDNDFLTLGLKSTAQTATCALSIFERIYEQRFQSLGLSEALAVLRKEL